jgi:hypothetical protein
MERVKLKIKVIIPIYDRLGYMIPAGDYEILVTRITNAHVYGNIGQIEFSLPLRQLLKVISQQQYPTLGIRTALPPVTRNDSLSPVNGNSCMICLSTMRDTPVTLPCTHNFHRDCITTWLRRGTNSCPICRQRISSVVRTRLGLTPYQSSRYVYNVGHTHRRSTTTTNNRRNTTHRRSSRATSTARTTNRRTSRHRMNDQRLTSLPNLIS